MKKILFISLILFLLFPSFVLSAPRLATLINVVTGAKRVVVVGRAIFGQNEVLFGQKLGSRTDNVWRNDSNNSFSGGNIATVITVPEITVATTTGGSMATTSPFYFRLVVTDGAGGTSTPSGQKSQVITSGNAINISWTAVSGVDKYLVFWATSSNPMTKYFVATTTNKYTFATTTSYLTGAIPSVNTAYVNKISYTGNSWIKANNFGVGTSSPSAMLSVGNTGTTTLDFGRFCLRGRDTSGTLLYLYLINNGTWATSSVSCF